MKIPKRFKLMGQTIEVVYEPLLHDTDDCTGIARYRRGLIQLQPKQEGLSITQQHFEETFLHELFHWLFYMAGEKELRNNERLVAVLSGLLHQALTTMEYKDKEGR